MSFFERIANWLRPSPPKDITPRQFDNLLIRAREAKYSEDFETALEHFRQAAAQAAAQEDVVQFAITRLHIADILIRQEKWEDAQQLLQQLRQQAEGTSQRSQMAYILCALGTLAQGQGDWSSAREYYEQALELADQTGAAGPRGRATAHLAEAYLHEGNASYAVHLLRRAMPLLENSGDIEMVSHFAGVLGESLVASGSDEEGEQLLHSALLQAQRTQQHAYIRRWRLVLGQRTLQQGRIGDAQRHLLAVLQYFGRPPRPAGEYVQALCGLSRVYTAQGEHDEALGYARQAVQHAKQVGQVPLLAETLTALGRALTAAKQYREALATLQEAAQHYATPDQVQEAYLDVLRLTAAVQTEMEEPEQAIRTYQQVIELAEKAGLELQVARACNGLGTIYRQQNNPTGAVEQWTRALAIYEAEHEHVQSARLYCDLAAARIELGYGTRAMRDYEQALVRLNSIEDPITRGIVLANVAVAYADNGEIESAESFFAESIRIAQQTHDAAAEITRRGNYGWFLLVTGRARRALPELEHVRRMSEKQGLMLQAAVQTDNIGLVYDTLDEPARGLEHHREALERLEKTPPTRWQGIYRFWEASFKVNAAASLLALDRVGEAGPLLNEALAEGRSLKNNSLITRALTGLARAALQRQDANQALKHSEEAVAIARREGVRRRLAEALPTHSQCLAAAGQKEQAAAVWEETQKLLTLLHAPIPRAGWLNG